MSLLLVLALLVTANVPLSPAFPPHAIETNRYSAAESMPALAAHSPKPIPNSVPWRAIQRALADRAEQQPFPDGLTPESAKAGRLPADARAAYVGSRAVAYRFASRGTDTGRAELAYRPHAPPR